MTSPLATWLRLVVGCAAALVFVGFSASPALAHTDLDFTLPTDGAVIGDPLSEVRIAFTSPVTLVGNGFEVLDPQGEIRQPFAVTDDDMLFRLQMDPPLAGGDVGVRWEVRAEDGHVLSGSFSFTVDSPPPTTAPPTTAPPATAPPTTAAATTSLPEVTVATPSSVPVTALTATTSPEATDPAAGSTSVPSTVVVGGDGASSSSTGIVVGAVVVAVLAAGFLLVRSRTSAP